MSYHLCVLRKDELRWSIRGGVALNLFSGIELFVKTVEAGSFSKLGRQLNLAPSSISRKINALEAELGARLLHRTTRAISLTEAGQTYYHRVRKILQELDDAHSAIDQLQAAPAGILRLNVATPFGERIIVPRIPAFLERYPGLNIDLTLEDRIVNLVDERVDLAIRIGRLEDTRIVARKLAENRFVICGSPNYFQRHGTPQTPPDLSGHNCITNKSLPNAQLWQFRKGKSAWNIPVTGTLQANTGGALFQAVMSGFGIATLPTWYVSEEVASGRLQPVLLDYEVTLAALADSGIYALYPVSQFLPPKVRVFIDYLVESFARGAIGELR